MIGCSAICERAAFYTARAWSGSRGHSPTVKALMRLMLRLILAAYLLRVSVSTDATP
jgi:hypothetical protein